MTTTVDLPADPRWAPVAAAVVQRSAGRLGFDVDRLDDVLLASDELISCMVDESDPDRVLVTVENVDGSLLVTVAISEGRTALSTERWGSCLAAAVAGSLADEVRVDRLPEQVRLVFAGR